MRTRTILLGTGVAVLAVGIGGVLFATGLDTQERLVADREAAARGTDLATLTRAFDALNASDVVAALAEASYHTAGTDPVHQATGIAPPASRLGPDVARTLDGLRGSPVRFMALGQCEGTSSFTFGLAFGPGVAPADGEPPATVTYVPFPDTTVPCDGGPHLLQSDAYVLPPSDDAPNQWVRVFWTPSDDHDATVDRLVVLVARADSLLPDREILEATARQAFPSLHTVR